MKISVTLASLFILSLTCSRTDARSSKVITKRALSGGHDDDKDDHGHETETTASTCAVSSTSLTHEFSELAEERNFMSPEGELCTFEEEHHHEEGENETETAEYCEQTFHFVEQLLVHLNVTTPCCLGLNNKTMCEGVGPTDGGGTGSGRTPVAQAYGYGFLMVMLVSFASLVGLLLLPFTRNKALKSYYQYIYALLIALGASALFCDAVLHLIPEAFGLHDHANSRDAHGHSEEEDSQAKLIIWRSCVVILGLYAFFLFEFVLHSWNTHSHSLPSNSSSQEEFDLKRLATDEKDSSSPVHTPKPECNGANNNEITEVSFPHSSCRNHEEIGSGIIHPIEEDACNRKSEEVCTPGMKARRYILGIKPLAWLIILGDGLHNFADGLALGAAIAQSLSLGISTTIALVFHEIPHELGDFVVLLSTGMSWYGAIFFNFMSALAAVVGFFVGVGIGTNSSDANNWILAMTAGVFLYIALVDLLPELIHTKEKGCNRLVLFVMVNVGFFISFAALLLLAIYEEQLNSLISV